jgi:hypothetical protein
LGFGLDGLGSNIILHSAANLRVVRGSFTTEINAKAVWEAVTDEHQGCGEPAYAACFQMRLLLTE